MPRTPPRFARCGEGVTAHSVLEMDVTNDTSVERAVDAAVAQSRPHRRRPSTTQATIFPGWRKLSPPNKRSA